MLRKSNFNFFRIELSLGFGVPDNEMSVHFGVHENKISLYFRVPDNQMSLFLEVPKNCSGVLWRGEENQEPGKRFHSPN